MPDQVIYRGLSVPVSGNLLAGAAFRAAVDREMCRITRRAQWDALAGMWADVVVGDAYDAHVRIKLMERALDGAAPVEAAHRAYRANPLLNATPGEVARRAARDELARIASGYYSFPSG